MAERRSRRTSDELLRGLDVPQLVVLYLEDRLVVEAWTEDGRPRTFRPGEPDRGRPPPTFSQAMATVGAMLSHVDNERLAEILVAAPEHWLQAWVDEALAREGISA